MNNKTKEILNFLRQNDVITIGGPTKMRGPNNQTPIIINYHGLYQPDVASFIANEMAEKISRNTTGKTNVKIACSVQGSVIAYEVAKKLGVPLIMLNYINEPYYPEFGDNIYFIRDVIETGRGSARAIEKITRRDLCIMNVMCVFDYRMHLSTKVFMAPKPENGELSEKIGIQIQSLVNINHLAEEDPTVNEWCGRNRHLFGKGNRYIPGQS